MFARPFEVLRYASDVWQAVHGTRPRVFLASLGPVAIQWDWTTWNDNYFELYIGE